MKQENQQGITAGAVAATWHNVGEHFGYRDHDRVQWVGELDAEGKPTGEGYALIRERFEMHSGDEFGWNAYCLRHYADMPGEDDERETDDLMEDLGVFSTEEDAKEFAAGYDLALRAPNNLTIRLLDNDVRPVKNRAGERADSCLQFLYVAEKEKNPVKRERKVMAAARDLDEAIRRLNFMRGCLRARHSDLPSAGGAK